MTPDELRQVGVSADQVRALKHIDAGPVLGPAPGWNARIWLENVCDGPELAVKPGLRQTYDAYITALSPDVVKALIARVERAEAALREIAAHKTMDELEAAGIEQYVDESDFVTDFAGCVTTARAALAALEAS